MQINDFFYLVAAFGVEPVKAAFALTAGVAVFDHPAEKVRRLAQSVEGIVGGQRRLEAGQDMRHQVEADQIEKPENTGPGNARGPPEYGIGFLDADTLAEGFGDRRLQPEGADTVGDKPRCVFGGNHAFPHLCVGEIRYAGFQVGIRIRAGDDLKKPHVAGRIEKMGNEKAFSQVVIHPLRQYQKRQG